MHRTKRRTGFARCHRPLETTRAQLAVLAETVTQRQDLLAYRELPRAEGK